MLLQKEIDHWHHMTLMWQNVQENLAAYSNFVVDHGHVMVGNRKLTDEDQQLKPQKVRAPQAGSLDYEATYRPKLKSSKKR